MDLLSAALVQLNLATRARHPSADEPWLSLLRNGVTKLDYVRQLVRAYGFEAPLEAALAYTPQLKLLIDLRERSRAGLAAQDLLALGLSASDVANLQQCTTIEPFRTPLEALGWMYASERATLHFDAVRHYLEARLPDADGAFSYLSVYRGNVNRRWNELGHVIDSVAKTESTMERVVSAAHDAFHCMNEWYGTAVTPQARHG